VTAPAGTGEAGTSNPHQLFRSREPTARPGTRGGPAPRFAAKASIAPPLHARGVSGRSRRGTRTQTQRSVSDGGRHEETRLTRVGQPRCDQPADVEQFQPRGRAVASNRGPWDKGLRADQDLCAPAAQVRRDCLACCATTAGLAQLRRESTTAAVRVSDDLRQSRLTRGSRWFVSLDLSQPGLVAQVSALSTAQHDSRTCLMILEMKSGRPSHSK
jgi:hypothetical protein